MSNRINYLKHITILLLFYLLFISSRHPDDFYYVLNSIYVIYEANPIPMILGTIFILYVVRNTIKLYVRIDKNNKKKEDDYTRKVSVFDYYIAIAMFIAAIVKIYEGKLQDALSFGLVGAFFAYSYIASQNLKKDHEIRKQEPKK